MEGIIFDVDGTLWDSTDVVALSWNRIIEDHTELEKRVTGKELMGEFGKPLAEIMKNLFPMLDTEERECLVKKLYKYENELVAKLPCKIYDGMIETIKELSKVYKLFIVSNCQGGYIEAFLENTKLHPYITDFTCPGETELSKGENIKLIMERNNIKKAVYIGDTQGDADACKIAEVPMVFAAYGFGQVSGEYTSIDCFKELLELDYDNVK